MTTNKGSQLLNKEQEHSDNSDINPFEDNAKQSSQQVEQKKTKKVKKAKKEKRSKKLKKPKKKTKYEEDYDYQDDEEDDRNSMFDDEAESGQEDYDDEQYEAEIGFEEERERFEELYKRPNATQRLMQKFKGKNERQINAQYSKRAHIIRQQQQLFPSEKDPKIYIVQVKQKCEDEMVLTLLNKAHHLAGTPNKISIISVISLRKKFPGRIFVQAFSQRDVYESLEGFNNVYLGKKIIKLENQGYIGLFNKLQQQKAQFHINTFVRIKKGLYEGDLAKVFKVKKSSIDVLLVPRINIQEVVRKIRDHTSKMIDQKEANAKKQQLLRLFVDHRAKNYKQRPAKRQLFQQDFKELQDYPGMKSIRMGNINGLIILSYRPEELTKVHGTYLPVQIMPFTTEGNFMEEIKQEGINLATGVNFKIGEEVEIIGGELERHSGILMEVKDNVGIIRCKNKQMKGQILEEPLENLAKKFKEGQRVKVTSGIDIGKTGIILKIDSKIVQIWTDNSNTIRVNKKSLQLCGNETICRQNVHGLKKDDLIKTNKNVIGVVIETTKDNIKIIDTHNIIQIIGNMDFDEKISIKNLVAKNKQGDQIKNGALVAIVNGINQGKRCRVVHVYRQFVFLFNENFIRTCGICVEVADNCSIVSKNDTGRIQITTKNNALHNNQCFDDSEEIKVGMTITLKAGPLKGYKGIVKSINKEKIEVRVLSKACTEWVPRVSLTSRNNEQNKQDGGKTPSRLLGSFRGFDQPSPAPNYD